MFAPELGLAFLENCPSKPREQQIWTYRSMADVRRTARPRRSRAPSRASSRTASLPSLSADARRTDDGRPAGAAIAGYHVERARRGSRSSEDQLERLKKQTAAARRAVRRRDPPHRRIHRASPPQPLKEPTFTDTASISPSRSASPASRSTSANSASSSSIQSGQPYRFAVFAYRVRAVNAAGVESGPSPPFFTIPSAPQSLFSREDGATCHLKWEANPEKALKGYRVYRMDGRYDKDAIPRLTADPIAATTFSDDDRRQDHRAATTSSPSTRSARKASPPHPCGSIASGNNYYKPFIGEWHQ